MILGTAKKQSIDQVVENFEFDTSSYLNQDTFKEGKFCSFDSSQPIAYNPTKGAYGVLSKITPWGCNVTKRAEDVLCYTDGNITADNIGDRVFVNKDGVITITSDNDAATSVGILKSVVSAGGGYDSMGNPTKETTAYIRLNEQLGYGGTPVGK